MLKGLEKETGHGLRMVVSKYPIVIKQAGDFIEVNSIQFWLAEKGVQNV